MFVVKTSGLYYKHVTIVNDDSRVINIFEASLTDDARVIIYDHHMFIVQANGLNFFLHLKTFCDKICLALITKLN